MEKRCIRCKDDFEFVFDLCEPCFFKTAPIELANEVKEYFEKMELEIDKIYCKNNERKI